MTAPDSQDPAVERALLRFHEKYDTDLAADAVRSVADYIALFPACEDAIRAELSHLGAPPPTSEATTGGLSGQRIGSYLLERELGHGGQGYVWLARSETLNRPVALKLMAHTSLLPEKARLRFRREAEAAAKLNHPALCAIYEVGEHEGIPFIAMQHVDGESLAQRIAARRRGEVSAATIADQPSKGTSTRSASEPSTAPPSTPLEISATIRYFRQVALALHAAHEAGLVHRDIKPANLMIDRKGAPVLLDFGLASDADSTTETLTQSGDLLGTPAYMSPEQVEGSIPLDRRTDIYSLGVSLFEALTLSRPHSGVTRHQLLDAICAHDAPNSRSLNPALPRDLSIVIATAMARSRNDRYRTAEELADELHRIHEHKPILARPTPALVKLIRWTQRNRAIAALLVFILLMSMTTSAVFLWQNRSLDDTNRALSVRGDQLSTALEQVTERNQSITRLADGRDLRLLKAQVKSLVPCVPSLIPDLTQWIQQAERLMARRELHQETLEELQAKAGPYTAYQKERDHPETWAEAERVRENIEELQRLLEGDLNEREEERIESELFAKEDAVAALEAKMATRRTWLDDPQDAWRHELLAALLVELGAFEKDKGPLPEMRRRLETARQIEEKTLALPSKSWESARARVKTSPLYLGLDLAPQLGLIPLGQDPMTGHEDFLHWESHQRGHPVPQRKDGVFVVTKETGIILRLLPGGTARLGARPPSTPGETGPHIDPQSAGIHEGPDYTVELEPFFISRYEMTQAQWTRAMRSNPSTTSAGTKDKYVSADWRHPVEALLWNDARDGMRRLALELPTEVQWEYAVRGGRGTIYHWGDDFSSVSTFENIADRHARRASTTNLPIEEVADDGYFHHAPVGTFRANHFGLYDMGGNVSEWCRDRFSSYADVPANDGDGFRAPHPKFTSPAHVFRGASFSKLRVEARSAYRGVGLPGTKWGLGVRPARSLDLH